MSECREEGSGREEPLVEKAVLAKPEVVDADSGQLVLVGRRGEVDAGAVRVDVVEVAVVAATAVELTGRHGRQGEQNHQLKPDKCQQRCS